MTHEQLNKIEKLAEEARPGPWARTNSYEVADLWASNGSIPVLSATSDKDVEFIRAMREFALPMVKALREESAARDRAEAANFRLEVERNEARDRAAIAERLLRETCDALHNSVVGRFAVAGELYVQALPRVEAALNDARSEVEQMKAALQPTRHDLKTCCCPDCCTLRQVTEERDRARAEIKRLNKLLNSKPKL